VTVVAAAPGPLRSWWQPVGESRLVGRVLTQPDLSAVIALHRRVLADLPPGLLNRETDAFFADHLAAAGRVLGLQAADESLVAYAVLGLPAAGSAYNFGRDLGVPAGELGLVAHIDGAAVAGPWRGLGLHRVLVQRRIDIAVAAGRRHITTTIAPTNVPSLRTCLSLGLRARALRPMFDAGHLRLLLWHDLAGDPPLDLARAIAVPFADTGALAARLAAGAQGFAWRQEADGPALLLAPPAGESLP